MPDFAVPLTSAGVDSVSAVEPAIGSLLARRIAAGATLLEIEQLWFLLFFLCLALFLGMPCLIQPSPA